MSNQSVPYYRVPAKAPAETMEAIRRAAYRSPSLRVLLNHIAALEDELSDDTRDLRERRALIGGKQE